MSLQLLRHVRRPQWSPDRRFFQWPSELGLDGHGNTRDGRLRLNFTIPNSELLTALYLRTYRTSCRCRSAPAWKCRTRCTSQFRSSSPRRAWFGPSCTSRFSVGENRCAGSGVFSAVAVSAEEGGRAGEVDRVKLPQARTSASPAAFAHDDGGSRCESVSARQAHP